MYAPPLFRDRSDTAQLIIGGVVPLIIGGLAGVLVGVSTAAYWAIAVLAFPSLFVTASTGTTDVLVGAMLALALVLWRRPAASAGVLAIAAWFKLAPALLAPIWLASRRGRARARNRCAPAGAPTAYQTDSSASAPVVKPSKI